MRLFLGVVTVCFLSSVGWGLLSLAVLLNYPPSSYTPEQSKEVVREFAGAISDPARPYLRTALLSKNVHALKPQELSEKSTWELGLPYQDALFLLDRLSSRLGSGNPEEVVLFRTTRSQVIAEIRAAPERYLEALSALPQESLANREMLAALLLDASQDLERPLVELADVVRYFPGPALQLCESCPPPNQNNPQAQRLILNWVTSVYGEAGVLALAREREDFREVDGIADSIARQSPQALRALLRSGFRITEAGRVVALNSPESYLAP